MRTPILLSAVVLALSGPGCGGGSTAGGGSVPADGFPARFASTWCAMMMKCCQAAGGTGDSACEAEVAAEMTARGTSAAADGAAWNATAAGQCLDMLGRADCASTDVAKLVAMLDICDDIWTGVVPPGGACMTYSSCAELPVSGGASAGASCVNSMCVAVVRQPPGAACSTATTMLCDPLQAECAGGVCVALPTNGQSCAGSCHTGSACMGGVCMPLHLAGALCSVDNDCASGRCVGGTCASVLAASDDYCTLP